MLNADTALSAEMASAQEPALVDNTLRTSLHRASVITTDELPMHRATSATPSLAPSFAAASTVAPNDITSTVMMPGIIRRRKKQEGAHNVRMCVKVTAQVAPAEHPETNEPEPTKGHKHKSKNGVPRQHSGSLVSGNGKANDSAGNTGRSSKEGLHLLTAQGTPKRPPSVAGKTMSVKMGPSGFHLKLNALDQLKQSMASKSNARMGLNSVQRLPSVMGAEASARRLPSVLGAGDAGSIRPGSRMSQTHSAKLQIQQQQKEQADKAKAKLEAAKQKKKQREIEKKKQKRRSIKDEGEWYVTFNAGDMWESKSEHFTTEKSHWQENKTLHVTTEALKHLHAQPVAITIWKIIKKPKVTLEELIQQGKVDPKAKEMLEKAGQPAIKKSAPQTKAQAMDKLAEQTRKLLVAPSTAKSAGRQRALSQKTALPVLDNGKETPKPHHFSSSRLNTPGPGVPRQGSAVPDQQQQSLMDELRAMNVIVVPPRLEASPDHHTSPDKTLFPPDKKVAQSRPVSSKSRLSSPPTSIHRQPSDVTGIIPEEKPSSATTRPTSSASYKMAPHHHSSPEKTLFPLMDERFPRLARSGRLPDEHKQIKTIYINMNTLLAGELSVSIDSGEIETESERKPSQGLLKSIQLTFNIVEGVWINDIQKKLLRPILFHLSTVTSMPAFPVSYQALRETCEPAYLTMNTLSPIHNLALTAYRTKSTPQDRQLNFHECHVVFPGGPQYERTKKEMETTDWVVEVHDRDPKDQPPHLSKYANFGAGKFSLKPLVTIPPGEEASPLLIRMSIPVLSGRPAQKTNDVPINYQPSGTYLQADTEIRMTMQAIWPLSSLQDRRAPRETRSAKVRIQKTSQSPIAEHPRQSVTDGLNTLSRPMSRGMLDQSAYLSYQGQLSSPSSTDLTGMLQNMYLADQAAKSSSLGSSGLFTQYYHHAVGFRIDPTSAGYPLFLASFMSILHEHNRRVTQNMEDMFELTDIEDRLSPDAITGMMVFDDTCHFFFVESSALVLSALGMIPSQHTPLLAFPESTVWLTGEAMQHTRRLYLTGLEWFPYIRLNRPLAQIVLDKDTFLQRANNLDAEVTAGLGLLWWHANHDAAHGLLQPLPRGAQLTGLVPILAAFLPFFDWSSVATLWKSFTPDSVDTPREALQPFYESIAVFLPELVVHPPPPVRAASGRKFVRHGIDHRNPQYLAMRREQQLRERNFPALHVRQYNSGERAVPLPRTTEQVYIYSTQTKNTAEIARVSMVRQLRETAPRTVFNYADGHEMPLDLAEDYVDERGRTGNWRRVGKEDLLTRSTT